jgi:hypothetical protein
MFILDSNWEATAVVRDSPLNANERGGKRMRQPGRFSGLDG